MIKGQPLINGLVLTDGITQIKAEINREGVVSIKKLKQHELMPKMLTDVPLIRGIATLINSIIYFLKALNDSIEEISKVNNKSRRISFSLLILLSLIAGATMAIVLFLMFPAIGSILIKRYVNNALILSVTEGFLRIIILYVFLKISTKLPALKNLFMFHGAYHKLKYLVESKMEISKENMKASNKYDNLCSLGFLLDTLIITTILFSILQIVISPFSATARIILFIIIGSVLFEIKKWVKSISGVNISILPMSKAFQSVIASEPTEEIIDIVVKMSSMIKIGAEYDKK